MKNFKVGQKWLTRGGDEMTITNTALSDATTFPLAARAEGVSYDFTYTEEGLYFADSKDSNDLITQVVDEFIVGDTWLDAKLVEITINELNGGYLWGVDASGDRWCYRRDGTFCAAEEETSLSRALIKKLEVPLGFGSQEEIWNHLLDGGTIKEIGRVKNHIYRFKDGYLTDIENGQVSSLNFTIPKDWAKYEVWKPRKPTLCFVSDSVIDDTNLMSIKVIIGHDEARGLYITQVGADWKYVRPLTLSEAREMLDECD